MACECNWLVGWFVGLSLFACAPDHTTLARFHAWLALQSPAAWAPRLANLLLDLCADLIAAWQRHAPHALQAALPPLDLRPILHPARPRDALERQALLAQVVSLS